VSQKKQDTKLLPITLPNIGRFSLHTYKFNTLFRYIFVAGFRSLDICGGRRHKFVVVAASAKFKYHVRNIYD